MASEFSKSDMEHYGKLEAEYGEKKAWPLFMRWKGETDLYWFGVELLGLGRAIDSKSKRKRIDPKVHRRMAAELQADEDSLHLYFRGGMKSTWMQLRIVQSVLQNPYSRRGYWSATQGLVVDNLKIVKLHLANQRIMRYWPDVVPPREEWEKDTTQHLTVFRDPEKGPILREDQVEAYGVTGNVTGRHYDEHYYDDVINEKSVTSPEMLHKTRTWWDMMQAVKDASAVEKMIGTYYHQQDIYNMIESEDYFPTVTKLPAIVGDKIQYSFFTKKGLDKIRRRMTPYNFSCQYLLNPIPTDDRMFLPPYSEYDILPENAEYYIAVDPAATTGKWSDKTGIVIGAIDPDSRGRLYIVEARGYKEKPDVVADILVRKIMTYRPKLVGIEYGLQEALQFIIDTKMQEMRQNTGEGFHCGFKKIKITREGKADKINRTIGVMHRDGRLLYNKLQCGELIRQMGTFNPNVGANEDDVLDAASMLVQTVPYFHQAHWLNAVEDEVISHFTLEYIMKMAKDKHGKDWEKQFAC